MLFRSTARARRPEPAACARARPRSRRPPALPPAHPPLARSPARPEPSTCAHARARRPAAPRGAAGTPALPPSRPRGSKSVHLPRRSWCAHGTRARRRAHLMILNPWPGDPGPSCAASFRRSGWNRRPTCSDAPGARRHARATPGTGSVRPRAAALPPRFRPSALPLPPPAQNKPRTA